MDTHSIGEGAMKKINFIVLSEPTLSICQPIPGILI